MSNEADRYQSKWRAEIHKISENTIYHALFFPPYTVAGYKYPVSVWRKGGCVVFNQTNHALLDIFNYNTSLSFLNPAMAKQLLDQLAEDNRFCKSDLTLIVGGGSVKCCKF